MLKIVRLALTVATCAALVCGAAAAESIDVSVLSYRVIDGDTIAADLEVWPGVTVHESRIRLRNIDTAEIFSPKCDLEKQRGLAARDALTAFLAGKKLRLVNVEQEKKWGGVVVDLYAGPDDAAKFLVDNGYAVVWLPHGPKPRWCDVTR